ncbi:MAG: non-homologous end-joining DNA ligase [Anaerolineales bacterium]|jgi:bifunctional non-homologous end joining protein LigD
MSDELEIDDHTVEISHREKLFFPDEGLTKGDLVDYYRRIAEVMLPHLKGRPISMQRFPDGITGEGFYQKEAPDYFPDWIQQVDVLVEGEGEKQPQVIVDGAATLVYLANQACITPHTWLSRAGRLDQPDKLIFDLDPPGDDFNVVREAAYALHNMLEEIRLVSYVMTTGSRGLHVVLPLKSGAGFDNVRDFAHEIAAALAAREPEKWTVEVRKAKRDGRLFLDTMRNAYAQTSVPPYAVRALPAAPVATPIEWDELSDHKLNSQTYSMMNIFRRLGQKSDPWIDIYDKAVSLDHAWERFATWSENRG